MQLEKIYNATSFEGYISDIAPDIVQNYMLASLFPTKKIDGLEYSYIIDSKGTTSIINPSAYDAEVINQHREGFDMQKGELPLFRQGYVLSEKEKSLLNLYMKAGDMEGIQRKIEEIYDDQTTLLNQAMATQEYLRAKALIDGKIGIRSNGGVVAVDYGVPADNKYALTGTDAWTDVTAPIVDQIKDAIEKVELSTGIRPTKMILNRATWKLIEKNEQIKDNLLPMSLIATARLRDNIALEESAYLETFKALTGLSDVMVYNKRVKVEGAEKQLIDDFKVAIFADGELGKTYMGTSPAELNMADAKASGANIAVTGDGFAINTYSKTIAPYTSGTQIEFVSLPSLPTAHSLILMTVA